MASTKLIFIRTLVGTPLTEVAVECLDMVLTNVVIITAGKDWVQFRQTGSGGLGDVWVPTQNIGAIII